MVWEYKLPTIVMLTETVEAGRVRTLGHLVSVYVCICTYMCCVCIPLGHVSMCVYVHMLCTWDMYPCVYAHSLSGCIIHRVA